MAHHGNGTNPAFMSDGMEKQAENLKKMQDQFKEEMANNMWPNGMMREDDEGVLPMAVGTEKGRVMIQFPEPTAWVGMTPEQAMNLAQSLISHARKAGLTKAISIAL